MLDMSMLGFAVLLHVEKTHVHSVSLYLKTKH
jgi:hypothetical protein